MSWLHCRSPQVSRNVTPVIHSVKRHASDMLAGNGLGLPRSQETRAAASNLHQQGGADSPVGILATIATDANRASQSSGSRGTTGVTTPGGQRKGYILLLPL